MLRSAGDWSSTWNRGIRSTGSPVASLATLVEEADLGSMKETNRPLFVRLRIEDRGSLRQVVDQYSSMEPTVETVTIVDPSNENAELLYIDIGHVTDKQWEALEMAHELGHYASPRGGNLQAIADKLGISKSAASQRLRAAESKIISAILGTNRIRSAEQ